MKKIILCVAAVVALMFASCGSSTQQTANYSVIPLPQEITMNDGDAFLLSGKTVIVAPADNDSLTLYAGFLADYIDQLTGNKPTIVNDNPGSDAIVLESSLGSDNPEGYQLTVTPQLITINGTTPAGTFYGIQTLRKSIPEKARGTVLFPAVTITDFPRFAYRGAMFDVSRHFFPVDSVKSFIDMLALHNINRMHWHLTDDQGWRVEIKSRPRLTEIGSKRGGTVIGHNSGQYDSIPYEGFFTQDEIRDIVRYAADRNITIIPEIDLPGHMVAALTAYPELGCTGGPYDVWQQWGVSEDLLCAGNDSTLAFIDDVLGEITELFPSELVHIGGDECPKVRWEACEKCQARIRELGLKTDAHSTKEQKLQSYVMEHAAKFLATKGRRIIGWDEILEGGMGPESIIMSWRGEVGGIEGAQKGHDVIMTPNSYLYFDYYQTLNRDDEPDAIGGYVPIEKVYGYEPYPKALSPEQQKHIIGVQANLWTEYIPTFSQVQYMELPRMAALAEVQWTMPEKKDYYSFTHRIPQLVNHYKALGYNYARHIFDINPELSLDDTNNAIVATLTTCDDAPVHYTLDGTEPTDKSPLYTEPLPLKETCVLKAAAFRKDGRSRLFVDSVSFNKATAHPIVLANELHNQYQANGASTLNDGRFGTTAFNDGRWVGIVGKPLDVTIDLQQPQSVSSVTFTTNVDTDNWIFDVRKVTVQVSANDKDWTTVATEEFPVLDKPLTSLETHKFTFPATEAKSIRIVAEPEYSMPDWHQGKTRPAFIFVDEIVLD